MHLLVSNHVCSRVDDVDEMIQAGCRSQIHAHVQAYAGMRVLAVATEPVSASHYRGKSRSMLVSNALLRLGGVAALLSNHADERRRAKWVLLSPPAHFVAAFQQPVVTFSL